MFFPPAGDRRQSSDVAAERHGDEVHGAEARTGAQALPPHREAQAGEAVKRTDAPDRNLTSTPTRCYRGGLMGNHRVLLTGRAQNAPRRSSLVPP